MPGGGSHHAIGMCAKQKDLVYYLMDISGPHVKDMVLAAEAIRAAVCEVAAALQCAW